MAVLSSQENSGNASPSETPPPSRTVPIITTDASDSPPTDALATGSNTSTFAETMASVYGRYDFSDEEALDYLVDISSSADRCRRYSDIPAVSFDVPGPHADQKWFDPMKDDLTVASRDKVQAWPPKSHASATLTPLFSLPSELIHGILTYLSAYDLLAVSASCWTLRKHALVEGHWHRLVQMNIPGVWLTSPSPCASFRELYAKHDRVWFLPKYKIWFCDRDLMGRLIVVRYDPRRGCIEGYQLLAVSSGNSFEHWPADDKVVIHGFEPKINLHLDKAILQFHVQEEEANEAFKSRPGANRFADEMPMALDERMRGMYSNFQLTRPLTSADADERLAGDYPYDRVWPPPAIPARHHVSGARSGQGLVSLNQDDKPRSRSQTSDQTFRIRQWMELAGSPVPPHYMRPQGVPGMPTVESMLDNDAPVSVHIGEETVTYSTLDPVLYTPTPNKPWRGIWVGDYGGHGCEFLLINQPDDPPATDEELGLSRNDYETDKEWAERQHLGRVHRGRLEAIKLTGDPNIPRGEYTFVVEDLGVNGCVGIATDTVFAGARVVKSKGHIAGTGFLRDKYIESQLILISPNKLAQYWVDFGHISFYERVDIDPLLKV